MVYTLSSIEQLREAAASLNGASDALGETVKKIDEALKILNLGIEAWTREPSAVPSARGGLYLGYAKVGSRWGLAIFLDSPELGQETWLFNDAPRGYRVILISRLTELFEELTIVARSTAANIASGILKLEKVREDIEVAGLATRLDR